MKLYNYAILWKGDDGWWNEGFTNGTAIAKDYQEALELILNDTPTINYLKESVPSWYRHEYRVRLIRSDYDLDQPKVVTWGQWPSHIDVNIHTKILL